jgi:hypothetical protein
MSIRYPIFAAAVVIETGVNDAIRMQENSGSAVTATVAPGTYYLTGADTTSRLGDAICTALQAAGALTYSHTVVALVDPATRCGTLTITAASSSFRLLLDSPDTTFDPALLGLPATTTGYAASHASTLSPSCLWASPQPAEVEEPTGERQVRQRRSKSGIVRTMLRGDWMVSRRLSLALVDERRVKAERIAADPARSFERFLRSFGDGRVWRYFSSPESSGSLSLANAHLVGSFVPVDDVLASFDPARLNQATALYAWGVSLRAYVASS